MNNDNHVIKTAGFIGDVHAEDTLLELSIAFFKQQGIQNIYCLGDFCDGYGDVDKAVSLICSHGITAVQGNHDIWCLQGIMRSIPNATCLNQLSEQTIHFMHRLPKTKKITTAAGEVILCHGVLDNEMSKVNLDDYGYAIESNIDLQTFIHGSYPSIMVNGHTHRRMVKQIDGKTIINSGTLYRTHDPCVTIVDFVNQNVYFYDIIDGVIKGKPEMIGFHEDKV